MNSSGASAEHAFSEETVPARWPERVIALGVDWQAEHDGGDRDHVLEELWLLLHAALMKYLRLQQGTKGRFDVEDLQDIASTKALDLLRKLHAGQWDPAGHRPPQLCMFIATLARNGLVDHVRKRVHLVETPGDEDAYERMPAPAGRSSPALGVESAAFARALAECAQRLSPRARIVWFFRVFYEMPSKEIAAHPEVDMRATAVDMSLTRSRRALRACMQKKGFDAHEIPPGVFAVLWEEFRASMGEVNRS